MFVTEGMLVALLLLLLLLLLGMFQGYARRFHVLRIRALNQISARGLHLGILK